MNQTHIHLLINHVPILGSIFGSIVLMYGVWTKSNQTNIAAYVLFIISSIGAGIAYLTGEGAEEGVEHIQGVLKATIKAHEEYAMYALISLIILGLASIYGVVLTKKNRPWSKGAAFVILILAISSFGLVVRAGYLGGLIRHTELNTVTTPESLQNEMDHE